MIEITQQMTDDAAARGIDVAAFNESKHEWITKSYTDFILVDGDPILDADGNPVLDVDGNPTYDQVRQEVTKYKITGYQAKPQEAPQLPEFNTANELVTINGYPSEPVNAVYGNPAKGDSLKLECDLVDSDGNAMTSISSGSAWRMPIEKILANGTAIDETKLDTEIVNGHVTATMTAFPSGGTWYISKERVNQSLDEIDAPWHVNMINMKFWVKE